MTPPGVLTRHDLDRTSLAEHLAGEPGYRVDQVWDGLYRRLQVPAEMTDLPKALRARLTDAAARRAAPRPPRPRATPARR